MIKLHTWLPNLVEAFTFYGGGGKGGGESSGTSTTTIDPMLRPYVTYGLKEARRLYQSGTPQYFPGQTYVSPSEATTQALGLAEQRAMQGSPLLQSAQQQALQTIQGRGVNPFLTGALQAAYAPTVEAAQEATRGLQSQASQAGRYGSGAMGQIAERQASALGRGLGQQLSNLAYQSSEAEAARQAQAIAGAPALSQADYQDIQNLMNVGQTREDYAKTALQSDIDRFNFQQNLPYQKLATFLSSVYGAPQGQVTQSEQQQSSGKIVCTAMNYAYGFGSFRQTIWLKHSATMHPAYEVGYHTLFLNTVMWAFDKKPGKLRKVVRNVLEHVARHRTADIWKQRRGKRDTLGMIYRAILEPICYVVGKVKGA
jgi:hypothetical protein